MKIVKLILWAILFTSAMWLSAIFLGPSAIKTAAFYFSEGKVKLSRVKVTPRLKVSAAVVEVAVPLIADGRDLEFVSRAVTVDWKVKGGFEFTGFIGPSILEDYGTLGSTDFTIRPKSMFNWSEVDIKLELGQLAGPNFEVIEGSIDGKIIDTFKALEGVDFVSPKASGKIGYIPFQVADLSVFMDNYKIGKPLVLQNTDTIFSAEQLLLQANVFEVSTVEGGLKLSSGEATFKISASNAHIKHYKLKSDSLSVSSRHPIKADDFEGTGEFTIDGIKSKNRVSDIEKYSGSFTFTPSMLAHNGTFLISRLELKADDYFIGQIENGILDVALTSQVLSSGTDLKGQGAMSLTGVDDFSASITVESSLAEIDILNCFWRSCNLSALNAKYGITFSGSSLAGNLKCSNADCFKRPERHTIQTDDTAKFFQSLTGTGILSPISLSMAYLAISSGAVVGDGHVLNF